MSNLNDTPLPNIDDTEIHLNKIQYEDERNVAAFFDSPPLFISRYLLTPIFKTFLEILILIDK